MGALELVLANLVNWRAEDHGTQLPERPGLSSNYTHTSMEGGTKFKVSSNGQRTTTEIYEQDPLFWCPFQLTAEVKSQEHFDHGKIKTRPIGPSLPEENEVVAVAAEVETHQKTMSISKRPLQILRLMYLIDAEERSKGVDWATFVRTMADVGFVARDAGGSAVSFENNGEGKIIFHKPHPDTDIDAHLLRIMAWRMTKWFGWSRESFVLRA